MLMVIPCPGNVALPFITTVFTFWWAALPPVTSRKRSSTDSADESFSSAANTAGTHISARTKVFLVMVQNPIHRGVHHAVVSFQKCLAGFPHFGVGFHTQTL